MIKKIIQVRSTYLNHFEVILFGASDHLARMRQRRVILWKNHHLPQFQNATLGVRWLRYQETRFVMNAIGTNLFGGGLICI